MTNDTHPHFIPDGESRKDTAILLVGTADEHGIDQRDIVMTRGGFRVSGPLADLLGYGDDEADSDEENPDEESFDPADHDIDAVKAFVTENPEAAEAVLDVETEGKNRKTLVTWLADFTNASGDRAGENKE